MSVRAGDSVEDERVFRRERERHSGLKANSDRSVATLALRLCSSYSPSSSKTIRNEAEDRRLLARIGVRGKGRSPFPLIAQRPRRASARRLATTFFPHRFSSHFETVCIMHKPVENAIGYCGIADLLVPPRHRQLRRQNHRSPSIAVFANFPEIAPFGLAQWRHRPIIDYQQINSARLGK